MRESEKRKNNIIIGVLLGVVVLMGIAYAAFASNLNITGTSSMSENWCIGFDSTRTSDYTAQAGIAGGTTPTGSMSFSGDSCGGNLKTTASLNASFKQPGDKVEYTLTIGNKGTLAAAIESINVDGDSVTSDTTITKGNIKYIIEMPESTSLAVNATTTMKVTAMFQNDTDISSSVTEEQTISIGVNAVQDDGSGGFTPTQPSFTGTIYRNNDKRVAIGDSMVSGELRKWCIISTIDSEPYNSCIDDGDEFNTQQECLLDIDGWDGAICQQTGSTTMMEAVDFGNYTTDANTLNKMYYLKHDIYDNIVIASYVCFVTDTEHCMQGGDYLTNMTLLQSQQTWFNNYSGSCSIGSNSSHCYGGGFTIVHAGLGGGVAVLVSEDIGCNVGDDGNSHC